jgi:hypothetical protein
MRASSGFPVVWVEGGALVEHRPEDVDAAPRERDEGLVVAFPFGALAVVEGSAERVAERAERRDW